MASEEFIPTFKDLSFYSDPDKSLKRYTTLSDTFKQIYKCSPDFFSRSPGRVTIIGDHIDYCYFSVLAMALDVDVSIAVGLKAEGDHSITLSNMNPRFKSETLEIPKDGSLVEIDQTLSSWVNYFKCSLIVAQNFIREKYPDIKIPLKGLNLLYDGNVPAGGGLSSSAAFCVSSTLAILNSNGVEKITKADLTRITVVCEHYVGVNTGGLDQCASIYGGRNKALLIQSKPTLVGIPFELPIGKPNDICFLVTNSLLESNKHETAPVNYNLRAVEAAVSAEYMATKFGLKLTQDSNLSTGTLRGFVDSYFEKILNEPKADPADLDIGIARLAHVCDLVEEERIFTSQQKPGFTTEEAASALNMSVDDFKEKFLSKFPVRYEKLNIYKRTKRIFSEALKTLQALQLMQNTKSSVEDSALFLQNFGQLMNESQETLGALYDASTPELENLCQIARENGAYGARVTGAAFGGSCVHLTTADKMDQLIKGLKENYYKVQFPGITEDTLSQALVVSKPAAGTCLVNLSL